MRNGKRRGSAELCLFSFARLERALPHAATQNTSSEPPGGARSGQPRPRRPDRPPRQEEEEEERRKREGPRLPQGAGERGAHRSPRRMHPPIHPLGARLPRQLQPSPSPAISDRDGKERGAAAAAGRAREVPACSRGSVRQGGSCFPVIVKERETE